MIPHEYFPYAYCVLGGLALGLIAGFCIAVYAAAGLPAAAADILNHSPKGK